MKTLILTLAIIKLFSATVAQGNTISVEKTASATVITTSGNSETATASTTTAISYIRTTSGCTTQIGSVTLNDDQCKKFELIEAHCEYNKCS